MEKWLQQVEQTMLASMREVIRLGMEAYVQVNENRGTPARLLVSPRGAEVSWISSDHPSVFSQNPH